MQYFNNSLLRIKLDHASVKLKHDYLETLYVTNGNRNPIYEHHNFLPIIHNREDCHLVFNSHHRDHRDRGVVALQRTLPL